MFEFALPLRVGTKGIAELRLALRLDGEHLAGVIENRSGGVLFRPCPLCIRERTKRWRFFADANVTRNEIGLFERDVESRVIREFEGQRFLHFASGRGDTSQLQKSAHAV